MILSLYNAFLSRVHGNINSMDAVFDVGFPTGVENMEGAVPSPLHWREGGALQNLMGGSSQYIGGAWGSLKCFQKYLWRSSFDSKVAGYKLASLQIY